MDYKQLSGREFPRFSGVKTFFRMPFVDVKADYDVGIFGIPYDGAVSYRPGARFAPTKVREMSSLGRGYHWAREKNFLERIKVADIGDCPTVPIDQKACFERIQSFVGDLLKHDKKFVAIGGDHSITLPVLRKVREKYGVPLRLIHFDAHLDSYPAAWGCEYHHGTFVRHAVEEKLIDPINSHQIGIRGPLAGADDLDFVRKHKINVHTVDDIRSGLKEFCKKIGSFDERPTYISFDIDCLDPAYAPGTGTPVVGGLTTYETQQILRSFKIKNLVGADIVEISPPFDHSDITALAGVDTLFEFLGIFSER